MCFRCCIAVSRTQRTCTSDWSSFAAEKCLHIFASPAALGACCLLLDRVALVRSVAAYSHQILPWTICRSVGLSVRTPVCPVHCGKTADRIRMLFDFIGRTGPWIRQVVWFGDGPREGVLFGGEFGRAIVTNGDFTAYVRDSAATVGTAVWGGACGGPRHCCIRWGPCRARRVDVWGFLFPIFTMRNAIGSLTVNCFRFLCKNSTRFPFGKHFVGKLDSWAFGDIFSFNINVGVYEKLAKK